MNCLQTILNEPHAARFVAVCWQSVRSVAAASAAIATVVSLVVAGVQGVSSFVGFAQSRSANSSGWYLPGCPTSARVVGRVL